MANSYWLHRISHEGEAAYVLLDEGYLTIGWSDKSDTGVLEHLDDDQFEQIMADYGSCLLYTSIYEAVNYHLERQLAGLPQKKRTRKRR